MNIRELTALGVFICTPALADADPQQNRVMAYCEQASIPLLTAGTQYVALLGSAVHPDMARGQVLKIVTGSGQYQKAFPEVKHAMEYTVSQITQPSQMKAHQDAMMARRANYLGAHGYSWAIKNVSPFTAWCNYNHLEG